MYRDICVQFFTSTTAWYGIALYRYIVIQKRCFNNPFCRSQLYNPILSIAL